MVGTFGLFLLPGGARGASPLRSKIRRRQRMRRDPWCREDVFGARVVLRGGKWIAEGIEEAAFKGAAGVEASSPSAGIGASAQYPSVK
jgi:hypothetical protein